MKFSINDIVKQLEEQQKETWRGLGIKGSFSLDNKCATRIYDDEKRVKKSAYYDKLNEILDGFYRSFEDKYGINHLSNICIDIKTFKDGFKQAVEIKIKGVETYDDIIAMSNRRTFENSLSILNAACDVKHDSEKIIKLRLYFNPY